MIRKVKQWLGIEGVRILIVAPDSAEGASGVISGEIHLNSLRKEKVNTIAIRLKEQYQRGRWKDKRISEFVLGEIMLEGPYEVVPDQTCQIPFQLPFEPILSDMDRIGSRNILLKGVVTTAKWIKGVESLYWIEAEARVKGTVLDAFSKKFIELR